MDKACNEVLEVPLNRKNWVWFKSYLFGSAIWYQKALPIKNGVKAMIMGNNSVNNNNNNGMNEIEKKTKNANIFPIKCSCGYVMQLLIPLACYSYGAKCNECEKQISAIHYMYHCSVGKNAEHPNTTGGFDYCLECAKKVWEKQKELQSLAFFCL